MPPLPGQQEVGSEERFCMHQSIYSCVLSACCCRLCIYFYILLCHTWFLGVVEKWWGRMDAEGGRCRRRRQMAQDSTEGPRDSAQAPPPRRSPPLVRSSCALPERPGAQLPSHGTLWVGGPGWRGQNQAAASAQLLPRALATDLLLPDGRAGLGR